MHPLIDTQQETGDAVQGIHKVIDLIAVFFSLTLLTSLTQRTHWLHTEYLKWRYILLCCISVVVLYHLTLFLVLVWQFGGGGVQL